ncbi:MAG: FtsW/RodA/SpoVE family cell cycle protein [Oscillospiraceae bacterium]|nr:FtsW/RodA/SpoVE family cell cycle protein [Oscillospiraceae bacterium]
MICLICSAISLFAVKTATGNLDAAGYGVGSTKCVIVQSASIVIGVGAFVVFTFVDPDILGNQWKILAAVNILLMIALIIFGSADDTGNKSWIRFAGIGIQPSEVIKILYVIVSAKQMTYLKEYKDINSFPSVVMMAGHFALVFLAIQVISSDLGSATIILAIFLVMFFCLGVKLYWFVIGFAAVAAVVPLLWTYFLKGYQKQRLLAPYDPSVDPEGYGIRWQTIQSRTTLASGRMTGVDAGHSTVFTGKHTDFIFSCIGEQLGMIGCIVVMILLTIIILRCYYIGIHSGRTFDMLVCCGMGTAIAFQTFINMGMCLGITPVIGLTLPFFSYGGSSMVTLFAAMGVVSGVKYKPKPERFTLAT